MPEASPPMPTIPTSNILSEASPDSIQELFSRFPLTERDIVATVRYMREQRVRLEATETVRHTRVRDDKTGEKGSPRGKKDHIVDFGSLGI